MLERNEIAIVVQTFKLRDHQMSQIDTNIPTRADAGESPSGLLRDTLTQIRQSMGVQSYYALGLALQKGLPYLLIPVLIRLYSDQTYASYVLFYSSTLMFANLIALAIPNSIIAFWYSEKDKASLSWTYILLLLSCQIVLALVLGAGAFYVFGKSFSWNQAALLTFLSFAFALLYNFNTFLTGICRARNYSKGYFLAQIIAGVVLVLGLIFLRRWPSPIALISMFMLSLACQNLYLAGSLRGYLSIEKIYFDFRLAKRVLAYSLPLIPYVGAILFYFWIDKYLVRLYFSAAQFGQFTISLQYAFAQTFFAQVFAMHTFPLTCQLVADRDHLKLRLMIRSYNFLLVGLGVACMVGIPLVQRMGLPLRVDVRGFILLSGAILLWNVSGNYANVLLARYKTLSVATVIMATGIILLITLVIGCWLHNLMLCYLSHLLWAAVVLIALLYLERTQRQAWIETPRSNEVAPQPAGGSSL